MKKLANLGRELLPNTPFSPGLVPSDYRLFQSLMKEIILPIDTQIRAQKNILFKGWDCG